MRPAAGGQLQPARLVQRDCSPAPEEPAIDWVPGQGADRLS